MDGTRRNVRAIKPRKALRHPSGMIKCMRTLNCVEARNTKWVELIEP